MKFEYANSDDTIFAAATPSGRSALAIVRVSGPEVSRAFEILCGRTPKPRYATLVRIRTRYGEPLDHGMVLFFPGNASPTGQDAGEFHLHGNQSIVEALSQELTALGLRLALPGEFTRRAVMAGKLDLTEAEGLADLLEAETSEQRRQALFQLYGQTSNPVLAWRERLLDALALVEADIDFSDEGDVQQNGMACAALDVAIAVRSQIATALSDRGVGERIREGFRVVIAGPPNAGKSTLMNFLAGRDVAIVTDIPGTTRDALEVGLDLGGFPVRLLDTAGLRKSSDVVESLGMERSTREISDADCVLWLSPTQQSAVVDESYLKGVDAGCIIRVGTQVDRTNLAAVGQGSDHHRFDVVISAVTGEGIDSLISAIGARLPTDTPKEAIVVTRARHRQGLSSAVEALDRLPSAVTEIDSDLVLWAEEFRLAIFHLGTITGHSRVDDVLDRIFASFCIGK